jgi:NAD(P)-dependent dehydrogenase (short-subunit alcohol dehydrogenase family)
VLTRVFDAVAEATVVPSFSRVGIGVRRRLGAFAEPPSMTGQAAIVTGATSGIGLSTAIALAGLGAAVHIVGRDPKRGAKARAAVEAAGPGPVHLDLVDLSDPEAVAAFGRSLKARYAHVDVLVHSAGALTRSYRTTPGGVEVTVATQVLGPYVLTAALAPLLWSASPATIVTVSSGGMYTQRFDLARLEMKANGYDGAVAYARSKRAQVVLAKAWARRFAPAGVASFSMHPGWADTPGLKSGLPRFEALLRPLLRTPEEGADTVVWLAAGGPASWARAENTSAPTSGFYLDRTPRRDHRFPVGSATTISDEEALVEWCAMRSGVKMPLAVPRGS